MESWPNNKENLPKDVRWRMQWANTPNDLLIEKNPESWCEVETDELRFAEGELERRIAEAQKERKLCNERYMTVKRSPIDTARAEAKHLKDRASRLTQISGRLSRQLGVIRAELQRRGSGGE